MIVDGRRANLRLRDPPGVDLLSAVGLSRFDVAPSFDDEAGGDGPELYVGLSDVKDCFHRIRQPSWLARYFWLQPVEAHHVGLTGHIVLKDEFFDPTTSSTQCRGLYAWVVHGVSTLPSALMRNSCPKSPL